MMTQGRHPNVNRVDNVGKKRSWTADEDAYLIKLVQKYGAQKWTSIAENLPGRCLFYSRTNWEAVPGKVA